MNLKPLLDYIFGNFSKNQSDLLDDETSSAFWEEITPGQAAIAMESYEAFDVITSKLRLHRKFLMKEAILAAKSRSFADLDARSLNFMLDYLHKEELVFLQELNLKRESIQRIKTKKKKKKLAKKRN